MQRPDEPLRSYIMRFSRLFKLLNGMTLDDVRMRTTSMHFVNSLRNYLSSKVENRLLGMNEKNYSLGDTFKVALECELKAIVSERRHAKCTTGSTNQVEVVPPQPILQSEEVSEVHVRNPNYKGKNYDPNFRRSMRKQHTQLASSNKIRLQLPTSTNQHTISQHRHTARTTTCHCPALLTSLERSLSRLHKMGISS